MTDNAALSIRRSFSTNGETFDVVTASAVAAAVDGKAISRRSSSARSNSASRVRILVKSNLCAEIIEYSDSKETAVCNLASIALNRFVDPVTRTFDYGKLHAVVRTVARNLNRVIDINFYPTERTRVISLIWRHFLNY
jgi:ribonucleotide reductase alpha subunit